ncbi:MAG: phosphate starvation-inducible protein PhoH [Rickettsiales bacterium]|nr:phosphate starvation-inducible protein PhoH [Rickettsiales bacterium]
MTENTENKDIIVIEFDDNSLLPNLYGEHNGHLTKLEDKLNVTLITKGNTVTIKGDEASRNYAELVLNTMWERLKKGLPVGYGEIKAAIRIAQENENSEETKEEALKGLHDETQIIKAPKRTVTPRSSNQAKYIKMMHHNPLVFGLGPAGTGKTYLAVAKAVEMYSKAEVKRIILCRPAVEAGERLGFLPGDMKEKVDPYFRPIYDALHDLMGFETMNKKIESGDIEIAPLAFMRGRTLSNAFIILDEAQNTTAMQMKMFLTRLGPNSRMVITGDESQVDLPHGVNSGLIEALYILRDIEDIDRMHFTQSDVVRHGLVSKIIEAYNKKGNGKS